MNTKKLWVLVQVTRGVPAGIAVYKKREKAVTALSRLRRKLNLDYDDADLFPVELDALRSKSYVRAKGGMLAEV